MSHPPTCRYLTLSMLVICITGVGSGVCIESPPHSSGRAVSVHHLRSVSCTEAGTGFAFSPLGVGFGISGELYVVDSDKSRVFVLPDSLVGVSAFADCPEELTGCQFIDIEIDAGQGIYVSEKSSGVILVFDRWGRFLTKVDVGEGIAGMGTGRHGQIYAAMTIAGTVQIVTVASGVEPVECVLPDVEGSTYPLDCLVVNLTKVLVTEPFSKQVLILGPLGNVRGSLTGFDFEGPFGLASYLDRYVLVSDSERAVIAVFSVDGDFISSFGDGFLSMPTYLDCRDDGIVCVADPGKLTIEVFRIERLVLE